MKGWLERRREEKEGRDLKNSDQVFICRSRRKTEKKKNSFFPVDPRIFLNVYSSPKQNSHCFFISFPVSLFSDYAIHLLFITKY